MCAYLQRLSEGLRACGLESKRVLLAVSGGADSVAMLRGTLCLQEEFHLTIRVAHLNHQLRGEESNKDARWLADLCDELGVRFEVGTENVRQLAETTGQGLEESARQIRYEFLEKTSQQQDCSYVAAGHTSDDQAETILHHILRGTGISGLRGMPRSRELSSGAVLVRPQLDITRREIETYLQEVDQDFRTDQSNLDQSYTRNRIRNNLLPLLQRDFNPQVQDALRRLGGQAEGAERVIDSLSQDLLEKIVIDKSSEVVRLDCDMLRDQSPYLVRACLIHLWKELGWPRQRMGFDEWDVLQQLILGEGAVMLPGKIEARRRGQLLVLRRM